MSISVAEAFVAVAEAFVAVAEAFVAVAEAFVADGQTAVLPLRIRRASPQVTTPTTPDPPG